jgi:hypothetical protein
LWRIWEPELLTLTEAPFPLGPETIFTAYYASAEIGCFLQLGWPLPARVIDLFAEFRLLTNGRQPKGGYGLVSALNYFGLPAMAVEEKDALRRLAVRGGPWQAGEPEALLDYCTSDVTALAALWPKLSAKLRWAQDPHAFEHAQLRGQYMVAAAHVERQGVPIDAPLLTRLRDAWPALKADVIRDADRKYQFWVNGRFKMAKFESWLSRNGYVWPRTDTGRPCLDREVLDEMSKVLPDIADFRDARHASQHLRLEKIAIDPDGRNRVLLGAFGTITGRNAPRASQFVFGPARWLRHLITPPPGHGLAYIDWSAQEFGISAALSRDSALLADYSAGDPYLAMAIRFGRAPHGATKHTHPEVRDVFKVLALAVGYGAGAKTLAVKLQSSPAEAAELLRQHHARYRRFWRWSDNIIDTARLYRRLSSPLGWRLQVHSGIGDRTMRNWMVQTTGSEMMRLALIQLIRAGVQVAACIHDAFLIEAPEVEIDRVAALTRQIMGAASVKTLRGVLEIRTDATFVWAGERYQEPRGSAMWERAMRLLGDGSGGRVGGGSRDVGSYPSSTTVVAAG